MSWSDLLKRLGERFAYPFGRPPRLGSAAREQNLAIEPLRRLLPLWELYQPWKWQGAILVTPLEEGELPLKAVRLWLAPSELAEELSRTFRKPLLSPQASLKEVYETLPLREGLLLALWNTDMALKNRAIEELIWAATMRAAFVGAIPIPFADVLFLTPLQGTALMQLSVLYGHRWDKKRALDLASSLGTTMFLRTLRRNLGKFLPLWGSLVGATLAASGTYALLQVAKGYFSSGSPLDFSHREKLEEMWESHYRQGEAKVRALVEETFGNLRRRYEAGELSSEDLERELDQLGREAAKSMDSEDLSDEPKADQSS